MEEALLTRGWIRILIRIVTTMGCAKSTRIEFTFHHCYIIIIIVVVVAGAFPTLRAPVC